ncbi:hypothetical protein ANO11243_091380 [Dothideomycetidae sp. 11243]|nr:hypothetical protein ANO11243_091380 [fungal sp. No.11243]
MSPTIEGKLPFEVAGAGKPCETYYKVVGDLKCGKPVLLALHGGPGLVHDYLMPLAELHATHGVPIVFYDQLGNGRSTHLREKYGDTAFWHESLFRAQLENLIEQLDLNSTGYDIIGHSWGGMLGSSFATYRPKGLRKLIISNSPAAMSEWIRSEIACCKALPQDVADALFECDKKGDYKNPLYMQGKNLYNRTYLCKGDVFPPPGLVSTFQAYAEDPTVNESTQGKTLISSGPLKDWTVIHRLHLIEKPTLLINGEFDVADNGCVAPFFKNIAKVKWIHQIGISHSPLLEDKDNYLRIIAEFLEY